MCCHYQLLKEDWRKFSDFPGFYERIQTDILESTLAPGLVLEEGRMVLRPLSFGLDIVEKKVLNARVETVAEKELFCSSYRQRKALFPCSLFFEKDERKKEHAFAGEGLLYLAGFYKQGEFALLTRPADKVVSFHHERMPLLIPRDHAKDYLRGLFSLPSLLAMEVKIFSLDKEQQGTLF